MPKSVVMLESTDGKANVTGPAIQADGWYGHVDGLHTIAIYVQNLKGRVSIEASLSLEPTEDDWFPIPLTTTTEWIEFPRNPTLPTGQLYGDTGVLGFTFRGNILWLRAKLDRTYLPDPMSTEEEIAELGVVKKIILSR